MNISKVFMGLASVVVATASLSIVNCARADDKSVNVKKTDEVATEIKEDAILFKIHDIVPVKNSDGEVVGCDYNTTFYNRSNVSLKGATVDLSWQDEAISDVIEQEKKEDAKQNKRSMGRARSTTERNTDKTVSGLVEVPAIKPLKQVVVQSRVNTDRCFLLIDNPKFDIRNVLPLQPAAEAEAVILVPICSNMYHRKMLNITWNLKPLPLIRKLKNAKLKRLKKSQKSTECIKKA